MGFFFEGIAATEPFQQHLLAYFLGVPVHIYVTENNEHIKNWVHEKEFVKVVHEIIKTKSLNLFKRDIFRSV